MSIEDERSTKQQLKVSFKLFLVVFESLGLAPIRDFCDSVCYELAF